MGFTENDPTELHIIFERDVLMSNMIVISYSFVSFLNLCLFYSTRKLNETRDSYSKSSNIYRKLKCIMWVFIMNKISNLNSSWSFVFSDTNKSQRTFLSLNNPCLQPMPTCIPPHHAAMMWICQLDSGGVQITHTSRYYISLR